MRCLRPLFVRENIEPVPSAGKTYIRRQARENMAPMPSMGKHVRCDWPDQITSVLVQLKFIRKNALLVMNKPGSNGGGIPSGGIPMSGGNPWGGGPPIPCIGGIPGGGIPGGAPSGW